jgi:hypothetical protein
VEGVDIMNSADTEPGIESELIELDGVPFTRLRHVAGEILRESMLGVVERTRQVRVRYRSNTAGGGERVD